MKTFLKNVFRGFVATLTAISLITIIWAFLTLALGIIILGSPVIFILFTYWSIAAKSFTDKAAELLDVLEEVLENAEKEIK